MEVLSDGDYELLFSVVSSWEMAIKVGLSRLRVCDDLGSCLSTYFAKNAMKVLPISLVHTVDVTGLPKHHRDPFDRLLIAQALAEKVPIVSADPQFARYPMEVLW